MNIVFNNDAFSQTQNAIQIQKILFNLSNENYSDSLSNLKSLGLFEKKPLHETFLRNIFWAFYLCPKQHSLLFDMFIWFLTYEDQFDDVKQSTKSFLLSIFLIVFGVVYYFNGSGSTYEDWVSGVGVSIGFGLLLLLVSVLYTLVPILMYKKTYYIVTNKKIVIRTGIIGIDYKTLDIDFIGSVNGGGPKLKNKTSINHNVHTYCYYLC